MPLKKKKSHKLLRILLWLLAIGLIILMVISFPAPSHLTETVVYP